jgi:hypothetical protein
MRSVALSILLVLLGACAGLGAAEVVVRLWAPTATPAVVMRERVESERGKFTRYDETLGWAGRANVADTFEWVDTRHEVRQNRHGFRGPEVAFERSAAPRIVVLGDSFVWGFGVAESELFTAVLEHAAAPPVEVVNLGVSGYGTDQALLLWRALGHRWQPDVVLVAVTLNTDFWDNTSARRYGYDKPLFERAEDGTLTLGNVPVPRGRATWDEPAQAIESARGGGWMHALARGSRLVALTVDVASRNPGARAYLERRGLILRRQAGFDWEFPLYLAEPDERASTRWAMLLALLERLEAEVAGSGARLVVAAIPSAVQVYPALWEKFARAVEAKRDVALDPEAPSRRLGAWAGERGVTLIDLLPVLRQAGGQDPYLYYPQNSHWTSAGHEVVGHALAAADLARMSGAR